MSYFKQDHVEKVIARISDVFNERPMEVGAGITLAVVLFIFSKTKKSRKKGLKRNFEDFDATINGSVNILNNSDSVLKREEVKKAIDGYENLFSGARKKTGAITDSLSVDHRRKEYETLVNSFYNLVTDFYEWGWGQSFHFAPRFTGETFNESIKRAEYHLCSRLGMKPGMKVIDIGCGVGGPMRNMCQFSGAAIDGVTINQYQVNIGNKYNSRKGLDKLCKLIRGDFQKLELKSSTYDAAYAIEATCHSPDKVQCFREVARVLKSGGLFAGYDWVMLPGKYDPNNQDHVRIKEGIEVGNGLPTLPYPQTVIDALESAGFEVLDHYDANGEVHSPYELPWYDTLNGSMTLTGFRMTHVGRKFTHALVSALELLRIAPKGSTQVSKLLNSTANDLIEGGQKEIFTPSYFFVAKKK